MSGPEERPRRVRIAHFGTFDVENYGDLLFPLVLERRLAHLGAEIVHVSPVGGAAVLPDARPSVSWKEAVESRFDAVVVGGGNIFHARETAVDRYRPDSETARLAYARLWLGASEYAARREIPLVLNGPGVPMPFGRATAPFVAWAVASGDSVALRDFGSALRIRRAGYAGPLSIIPDTALDVALLWDPEQRRMARLTSFAARYDGAPPERTVFIHLNERYAVGEADEIAGRIARIAHRFDAIPILGALGGCHGDGALARRVAGASTAPLLVLDESCGLRAFAAWIEASVAYVGSSLHGLITACAFGRPSILVARESREGEGKFSGFLMQWMSARRAAAAAPIAWVQRWEEVESQITNGAVLDRSALSVAELGRRTGLFALPLGERLDRHWQAVERALLQPPAACRARRTRSRRTLGLLQTRGTTGRSLYQAILEDQDAARS